MLAVENVHFAYGSRGVLKGLDLEAAEGELVGVVGPNGAGKTTLLRLVSGALRPSKGAVRMNGSNVADLSAAKRARLVSVVPQNPQLPLSFRLLDLVLMGRNAHLGLLEWEGAGDLEIAREAMELTDIWALADRAVGTLSGGERQRALVALALAQDAPLMLLDEPTASLDLGHQAGIMDLVRSVQRERGGAVVVSMHDLTLAAQYCDRLVMIADGQSYSDGPPAAVLTMENIGAVYGASVSILSHPRGGTPVVLPNPNGPTDGKQA